MRGNLAGIIAVLCAMAAVLTGCSASGNDAGTAPGNGSGFVAGDGSTVLLPVAERQPAPEFTGPTLDGGQFDLQAQRGKVVVMNVWASWCAPCRAEAPGLVQAAKAHEGTTSFVGLNTRDSVASAQSFVRRFKIEYPNVKDPDGQIQLLFRDTLPPAAIPSTLLIDKQGRVAARILGEVEPSILDGLIEDLEAE